MGIRYCIDVAGSSPVGTLYDSVSGCAYGPVFWGNTSDTYQDVFDWMDRAAKYARDAWGYKDIRDCHYGEIRQARDATAAVPGEFVL